MYAISLRRLTMQEIKEEVLEAIKVNPMKCPECENKLYAMSGCFYCPACGFISCEQ
jgi:uncharacterized Zn finger protein (UPF0148 family)